MKCNIGQSKRLMTGLHGPSGASNTTGLKGLDLSIELSHNYDQEMNSWNNLIVYCVGTAELA